jgi:large subunit ribosomal protein L29
MKPQELREKSKKELEELLLETRQKLFRLKLDLASGKLKNFNQIKQTKREIARILTILKEKQNA